MPPFEQIKSLKCSWFVLKIFKGKIYQIVFYLICVIHNTVGIKYTALNLCAVFITFILLLDFTYYYLSTTLICIGLYFSSPCSIDCFYLFAIHTKQIENVIHFHTLY